MTTETEIVQPAAAPAPVDAPVAAPAEAPIPAPAAAPVAAPAPEPKAFEETGDPALDVTFGFLNSVGVGADDPDVEAARSGDFTKIEAKLKALGDKAKGYEKHLALAKGVYDREVKAKQAAADAAAQAVFAAVGGEQKWTVIRDWASSQATDEQKAQINAAFAQGGLVAKATAEKLAAMYNKANPGTKLPASAVNKDAPAADNSPASMTSKQYAAAVDALARKANGRDISNSPEYRQLRAARTAARAAGVK